MLPVVFKRQDFTPADLKTIMAAIRALRSHMHEHGTPSTLRHYEESGLYYLTFLNPPAEKVPAFYVLSKKLSEGLARAAYEPAHLATVVSEIYSAVIASPKPKKAPKPSKSEDFLRRISDMF